MHHALRFTSLPIVRWLVVWCQKKHHQLFNLRTLWSHIFFSLLMKLGQNVCLNQISDKTENGSLPRVLKTLVCRGRGPNPRPPTDEADRGGEKLGHLVKS